MIRQLWMCFGICLITHACCGFHQEVCIHLCLFSLGSKPQLDSHLEGPVCFAHKQDGPKLAAQKACGLEWSRPTPQLHYWAMLMTQPPLIYSLFNTITLALVADLAGMALRHASFKKVLKVFYFLIFLKSQAPGGISRTLHSDYCWLALSRFW